MGIFAGLVLARDAGRTADFCRKANLALMDFGDGKVVEWTEENVALVLRSSGPEDFDALTPLDPGENGSLVVSASRLDQREKLAMKLGLCRDRAVNGRISDGSLLIAAYRRWGEQFVGHLQGDFGFAIWDRESRSLIAVRDRLGVFPFYYIDTASGFYFSNNLAVLLRSTNVPSRNARQLLCRLHGIETETTQTTYDGILRLPAAHQLSRRASGKAEIRRYWTLNESQAQASRKFEENSERLRALLLDCTTHRIPGEGNFGVELSGGLDSSAVAGSAARHCRDRLYSYSAIFPGIAAADDSELISLAASHSRIRNETFDATELDNIDYFERSLRAHGEFHSAGNIHIVMKIQELALRDGCRVVLNGADGDNVASHGLFRLRELAERGEWMAFGRCAKSIADIYRLTNDIDPRNLFNLFGKRTLGRKATSGPSMEVLLAPVSLSLQGCISFSESAKWVLSCMLRGYREGNHWFGPFQRDELNADTLDQTQFVEFIHAERRSRDWRQEREAQIATLSSGANENYFEIIHSISAKHGISTRFPFMDLNLIDFCLAVPSEHKLRDGWNRAILRHGMGDIYPPAVAWQRQKRNLSGGIKRAVSTRCLPEVRDALANNNDDVWQFLDRKRMRETIANFEGDSEHILSKVWMAWAMWRQLSMRY